MKEYELMTQTELADALYEHGIRVVVYSSGYDLVFSARDDSGDELARGHHWNETAYEALHRVAPQKSEEEMEVLSMGLSFGCGPDETWRIQHSVHDTKESAAVDFLSWLEAKKIVEVNTHPVVRFLRESVDGQITYEESKAIAFDHEDFGLREAYGDTVAEACENWLEKFRSLSF